MNRLLTYIVILLSFTLIVWSWTGITQFIIIDTYPAVLNQKMLDRWRKLNYISNIYDETVFLNHNDYFADFHFFKWNII